MYSSDAQSAKQQFIQALTAPDEIHLPLNATGGKNPMAVRMPEHV
jgi:hypothetical protein